MCSPDLLPAGSGSWPEFYSAPILNASCLSHRRLRSLIVAFSGHSGMVSAGLRAARLRPSEPKCETIAQRQSVTRASATAWGRACP